MVKKRLPGLCSAGSLLRCKSAAARLFYFPAESCLQSRVGQSSSLRKPWIGKGLPTLTTIVQTRVEVICSRTSGETLTDLIFLDQRVIMLAASSTPFPLPRQSQEECYGLQSQVVQYMAVPVRCYARDAVTSSTFACAESPLCPTEPLSPDCSWHAGATFRASADMSGQQNGSQTSVRGGGHDLRTPAPHDAGQQTKKTNQDL